MKVSYVSSCFDSSGYAMAARNHIAALDTIGVDVVVKPISFERSKTDLGETGRLCKKLVGTDDTKIQIIHTTPANMPKLINSNKYNIGYTTWETDKLPSDWVNNLNQLDEIWVPSTYNKKTFKASGVSTGIFCFPHPFKEEHTTQLDAKIIDNITSNNFIFYSIFQWLERKNPVGLIKAYLTEFTSKDNVVLLLKTFRVTPGSSQDANFIKKQIESIRNSLFLSDPPKILLISSLLTASEIDALHNQGDCLVSLNRCEGFGIPLIEAMQFENPVIATNYGGASDFLSAAGAFTVDYMLTPVSGMPWPTYTGDMTWADPDIMHARKLMRYVFTNQQEAKECGVASSKWIKNNLSFDIIGNKMKKRLEKIQSNLNE